MLGLVGVFNWLKFGFQGKSLKSFCYDIFLLSLFHFCFSTFVFLFGWRCSNDLLVRYIRFSFSSLDCISGLVLLCFLIFALTFDHIFFTQVTIFTPDF